MSQNHQLNLKLPRIGCDFNAVGLGSEPDDSSFYSFDHNQLQLLSDCVGTRVILYSFDTESDITACEAFVESYRSGWLAEPERSFRFCGYRAHPVGNTWYSGPVPWQHAL